MKVSYFSVCILVRKYLCQAKEKIIYIFLSETEPELMERLMFFSCITIHIRNKQTYTTTNIHHTIMRIEQDNCLTCSIWRKKKKE
jgi:hypothetical protein